HEVEAGEPPAEALDGFQVDRGVLADGGVRAAAGFDADDALRRQRLVPHQELRVLLGVDVVGDRRDVVAPAQRAAQRQHQCGLAGADGPADAHPERHDRKSLEYWVSWCVDRIASAGAKLPKPSSSSVPALAASGASVVPIARSIFCPSVWPSGTAFTAAITWFSTQPQRYAWTASGAAIPHARAANANAAGKATSPSG